jgi:molybdate transport system regulatory protein
MHSRSYRTTVRSKVWIDANGRFAVGDGGIDLLAALHQTGSIRAAADQVGWSYRHTLNYIDNMERALRRNLVEWTRGGSDRGGASLTPAGEDLLRRYTAFRRRADAVVSKLARAAFAGLL